MDKNILIVADPLSSLNNATDSSLALVQGFLSLGANVFWTTSENIGLLNGTPVVFAPQQIRRFLPDGRPEVHGAISGQTVAVDRFVKVLIRKDPPFDASYVDLCWILSQTKSTEIINNPIALLKFHEKLTPWSLAAEGIVPQHMMIPTLVSQCPSQLLSFAHEQFSLAVNFLQQFSSIQELRNFKFMLLCKPWRGHAGRGIQTFASVEMFAQWLDANSKEHCGSKTLESPLIAQPLLPEIKTQGDRRVFIVNGAVVFDFVRWPAEGRIEANLAQGGSATLEPMPEDVARVSGSIAAFLKKQGILIAGLDFIGERLTEVNITSPTGIRTYEKLAGQEIAAQLSGQLLAT